MEQVMWFFANEEKKIITQTLIGISEEERAIDILSSQAPKGRYILGYVKENGAQKIFKNSRQIVN